MRNVPLRLISFKRSKDEPEFIYALNDSGIPEMGKYYYKRSNGAFFAIQHILHKNQLKENYPIVEATDNPVYGLPLIPEVLVKAFRHHGIVNVQLRLP